VQFFVDFWGGEIQIPAIVSSHPENHPAWGKFKLFDGKRVPQSFVNVCERWYPPA
jgi:hypothetical protein